jgi:hypothetical protein
VKAVPYTYRLLDVNEKIDELPANDPQQPPLAKNPDVSHCIGCN